MPEKSTVADYQDALVELLASNLTHEEIIDHLKTDARFADYQDYINKFDPDMLAVASELVRKWAKRST